MITRIPYGLKGVVAMAQLLVLGCGEFARSALFLAALPAVLQHRLHLTSVITLGWLSGGLLYGSDTLLRSPSGWVVDRLGAARTSCLAALLLLAGVATIACAPALGGLAVGVMLVGAGMAPLWTSVMAGITGVAGPTRQAQALSVIFIAWLVGGGLGTFGSLLLLDRLLLGPTFAMLTGAAAVAAGAGAVAWLGTHLLHERTPHRAARPHVGLRTYARRLGAALLAARALIPGLFLQTFILAMVLAVVQRYATTVLQWTSGQVVWLLLGGGSVAVLLLVPISRVVDRHSPRLFLRVGFVIAAGPLAALAWVHRPVEGAVVAGLLGGSYALILTSWNALLARTVPDDRRGGMWGVFTTLEGLGAACGPPMAGLLWERISPAAPFVAGAVALLLIALVYSLYPIDRELALPQAE